VSAIAIVAQVHGRARDVMMAVPRVYHRHSHPAAIRDESIGTGASVDTISMFGER
jgi:hypothetical protein